MTRLYCVLLNNEDDRKVESSLVLSHRRPPGTLKPKSLTLVQGFVKSLFADKLQSFSFSHCVWPGSTLLSAVQPTRNTTSTMNNTSERWKIPGLFLSDHPHGSLTAPLLQAVSLSTFSQALYLHSQRFSSRLCRGAYSHPLTVRLVLSNINLQATAGYDF